MDGTQVKFVGSKNTPGGSAIQSSGGLPWYLTRIVHPTQAGEQAYMYAILSMYASNLQHHRHRLSKGPKEHK